MQFNVVVGNPPYNDDIYINFVQIRHTISRTCDCYITLAKWQAKGGQSNSEFREKLVPYIKDIVYYPNSADVFGIRDPGGVIYYILTKNKSLEKRITNISFLHKALGRTDIYNDTLVRPLNNLLSNIGYKVVSKIDYSHGAFSIRDRALSNRQYEVWLINKICCSGNSKGLCLWGTDGSFYV